MILLPVLIVNNRILLVIRFSHFILYQYYIICGFRVSVFFNIADIIKIALIK